GASPVAPHLALAPSTAAYWEQLAARSVDDPWSRHLRADLLRDAAHQLATERYLRGDRRHDALLNHLLPHWHARLGTAEAAIEQAPATEALVRAQALGNDPLAGPEQRARALALLGIAHWRTGDDETARGPLEASYRILRDPDVARALAALPDTP